MRTTGPVCQTKKCKGKQQQTHLKKRTSMCWKQDITNHGHVFHLKARQISFFSCYFGCCQMSSLDLLSRQAGHVPRTDCCSPTAQLFHPLYLFSRTQFSTLYYLLQKSNSQFEKNLKLIPGLHFLPPPFCSSLSSSFSFLSSFPV